MTHDSDNGLREGGKAERAERIAPDEVLPVRRLNAAPLRGHAFTCAVIINGR